MRAQLEISLALNRAKIGRTLPVIVEGADSEGAYFGRTAYDAPEIDNGVLFAPRESRGPGEAIAPGEIVSVKITDAFDYDLVGEEV